MDTSTISTGPDLLLLVREGTRWKEPVVRIQISYARRLETALMPKCHNALATTKVAPWLLISTPEVISEPTARHKRAFLFFFLND